MPTAQRRIEPGVIQRLLDQPQRFQFVQAVRLLVQWLRRHGMAQEQVLLHVLRFQNSLSLSFPASQIEALWIEADVTLHSAGALATALRDSRLAHIHITPAFMGFLGSTGVLPNHYTERIAAEQQAQHSDSGRAFFDTFSHRAVALYFQTWQKYRLEQRLDSRGEDGLLPLILAFGGMRSDAGPILEGAHGVGPDAAARYAALFGQRPVAASMLAGVLGDYFRVPVELEQFAGFWDPIPDNRRCRLSTDNSRLGYSAAPGVRAWRHDLRVRVLVGPLGKDDLERFLPRAIGAAAMQRMLALCGVPSMQYEVQLRVRASCIGPCTLGAGLRLGWDTYVIECPSRNDRADLHYLLHPHLS